MSFIAVSLSLTAESSKERKFSREKEREMQMRKGRETGRNPSCYSLDAFTTNQILSFITNQH